MALQVFSCSLVMKRSLPSGSAGYWSIPDEAQEMGRRARAFAESFFSTEAYVAGYQEDFRVGSGIADRSRGSMRLFSLILRPTSMTRSWGSPRIGFSALAQRVEFIHVITMRTGRVEVPDNVRVYSVGKEKGYSEPRRAVEFYRTLLHVLRSDKIDVCFSHMMPIFSVLAGPVLQAKRVPIITWYAHPSLTRILKLAHYFSTRMVTSVATGVSL